MKIICNFIVFFNLLGCVSFSDTNDTVYSESPPAMQEADLLILAKVISKVPVQKKIEINDELQSFDIANVSPLGYLTTLQINKVLYTSPSLSVAPKQAFLFESAENMSRHRPLFQVNQQYIVFLKKAGLPDIPNSGAQLSLPMPTNNYFSVVGQQLFDPNNSETDIIINDFLKAK